MIVDILKKGNFPGKMWQIDAGAKLNVSQTIFDRILKNRQEIGYMCYKMSLSCLLVNITSV